MKKIMVFTVFLLATKFTFAQTCTPPKVLDPKTAVGTWQGHYEENGESKTLKIELKEVEGNLESYVDMPDRGLRNAKFSVHSCQAADLHLERTGIDGKLLLIGKPNGDEMTGRFRVGDSCGPATSSFKVTKTGGLLSRRSE